MRLTIYSKPGCHLCDEMEGVVRGVITGRTDITLEKVDISGDRKMLDRYGLEIPVLTIDDAKVAKYRISRDELERVLRARGRV